MRTVILTLALGVRLAAAVCTGTGLCVVTVKPSGGDYATLAAAVSGEAANLVTANRIVEIDLYAMTDTTNVNVTGYTTDATHYVKLFVPTAQRHAGKWDATKYNLNVTGNFLDALIVTNQYTQIIGLQVAQTGAGANTGSAITVSSQNVLIDSVIVSKAGVAATADGIVLASTATTVRNSIIYGSQHDGIRFGNFSAGEVDNCTVVANAGWGISASATGPATPTVKNVYAGGNTSGDFNTAGGGTWTMTTSASSDATGTSGLTSVAYSTSTGAAFANITGGSQDFHIQAGSALTTAGTSLSGSFTVDIDRDTRNGGWSVGADQIPSAPPSGRVRHRVNQ